MHSTSRWPSHSERSQRPALHAVAGYGGYSGYGYRRRTRPRPTHSSGSSGGGRSSVGGSSSSASRAGREPGSSQCYTHLTEVRALTPIREHVEKRAAAARPSGRLSLPRVGRPAGVAKELHDLLERAVSRSGSARSDVSLGVPFLRAIDKGSARSSRRDPA